MPPYPELLLNVNASHGAVIASLRAAEPGSDKENELATSSVNGTDGLSVALTWTAVTNPKADVFLRLHFELHGSAVLYAFYLDALKFLS
eukprot:gnl/MRDRNA2_/MRDRNA2_171268_c0_seq1.p1 gnl/MRDRNA2_/MRDRNA2_171268_c0~~gnl/MRDRNA2_/MRDRNA2_171268_c0_seq1.p1  ORF type:complete len:104 (+),score=21.92 gnl/MRDRNA2_/MRDRNA2_171268_c0_seq1:48-314(+)